MQNPPFLPIPETCLLDQAALWVSDRIRPISDADYLQGGPRPEIMFNRKLRDLVLALRSGKLKAKGIFSEYRSAPKIDDSERRVFSENDLIDIPPDAWIWDEVRWPPNLTDGIHPVLKGPPESVHDLAIADFFNRPHTIELELRDNRDSRYWWITVATAELFALFPSDADILARLALPDERDTRARERRGRPALYDLKEFYATVAVMADLDGLPESQADLVRHMSSWCLRRWRDSPSETWLKEKLAPIYQAKALGRKFFDIK
jgi:hypothetical protein